MAMIFRSQSLSDGKLRGRTGSAGDRLANTFTNHVMFGSEGCREKGSFAASLMTSRAGQIMISHLNGNCFASAARSTDSLTFSRTTNVPTAPMFTTSNLDSSFASAAGWHRFVLPTFTARRKTTQDISEVKIDPKSRGRPGVSHN